MKILIKNGRVIDPANNTDETRDLLIDGKTIVKSGKNITESADRVIDASGMWVTPGLIDLHVHLREPGQEYKETIATGTRAAARGGFTTVCCMPNTDPVIDSDILAEYIALKAEKYGAVNVLPVGAITKGQKGQELAGIGKMAEVGICAVSEDGFSVENPALLKTAMKYASMFGLPVFSHCEETRLKSGLINAGDHAAKMGFAGISSDAEEVAVIRDIILARSTGVRLHICHISAAGAIEYLAAAKARGERVTAEATPHHFTLIDEDITDYDANYKVSPPLRSRRDRDAIIAALKSGVIDVIASDHAPHHYDETNCEFEIAENGISGLETSLALGVTELVGKGALTPSELIAKMTINPARIIRSDRGTLSEGSVADVCVIDAENPYKIDPAEFESKGKNTPFGGREVRGKAVYTIVSGEIVVEEGRVVK